MYNVCYRILKNHHDAEDILQCSFVDIFTKMHQFQFESTPGAWIKKIVVNNSINHLRKKKLHFEELSDNEYNKQEEYGIKNEMNLKEVHQAILALPDGFRIVLSLYLIEGYDHAEIADILNISESTSKSQFSRAKKKLRQSLSESNFDRYNSIA